MCDGVTLSDEQRFCVCVCDVQVFSKGFKEEFLDEEIQKK